VPGFRGLGFVDASSPIGSVNLHPRSSDGYSRPGLLPALREHLSQSDLWRIWDRWTANQSVRSARIGSTAAARRAGR